MAVEAFDDHICTAGCVNGNIDPMSDEEGYKRRASVNSVL